MSVRVFSGGWCSVVADGVGCSPLVLQLEMLHHFVYCPFPGVSSLQLQAQAATAEAQALDHTREAVAGKCCITSSSALSQESAASSNTQLQRQQQQQQENEGNLDATQEYTMQSMVCGPQRNHLTRGSRS
jgi:hypothetical protein